MKKFLLITLLVPLIAACANTNIKERDDILVQKVTKKAAFDFNCPVSDLSITVVEVGVYGAVGCGKRATYIGINKYCETGWMRSTTVEKCTVASDSFTRD